MSGRKKSDGEYHEPCERSEFYHMRELDKPAALFIAPDDYERTFLDSTGLAFELELDPNLRRPRTSERSQLTKKMHTRNSCLSVDNQTDQTTSVSRRMLLSIFLWWEIGIPVMLYVRKRDEQIYTPLHILPSSLLGLATGVANKFGVDAEKVLINYW